MGLRLGQRGFEERQWNCADMCVPTYNLGTRGKKAGGTDPSTNPFDFAQGAACCRGYRRVTNDFVGVARVATLEKVLRVANRQN